MAKCNFDCFNCMYPDCIATIKDIMVQETKENLTNAENCNNWYQRNKERKKAYQREYIRKKREQDKQNEEAEIRGIS